MIKLGAMVFLFGAALALASMFFALAHVPFGFDLPGPRGLLGKAAVCGLGLMLMGGVTAVLSGLREL